ncbi:MAG: MucB/RseB C-terminal domain-containing protein [Rhodospirillaceae bacterium]
MRIWLVVLLGLAGAAHADTSAPQPRDALGWLKKMAAASRQLNYSGTFVYQYSNQTETSKVVHFVNSAGGEFERLETLDGPPREVIRSNDQIVCYLPSSKSVLVEQRGGRHFPSLLPDSLAGIPDNYQVRKEERDRIAGHDCVWIAVLPRDNLRYGRRFCAEINSGLPLRARTVNEKNETVESFAFTQLKLGGAFNRDAVRSRYADKARAQNWRVDRSALNAAGETPADTGWVVNNQPVGFKKMMEVKRLIAGRSAPVSHIVFSDGLTAVSVFIEPAGKPATQSLSHQGAVNIFTRPYGGHLVTVLGEAPAATVMQIANSLELRSAAVTR